MTGQWRGRQAIGGVVMLCGAFLAVPAPAQEQFDRGEALYDNHCRACHEGWAHTREGRHVRTLAELRRRTEAWSVHSRLGWGDQEVDDVTDYLNRTFYHLGVEATP